MNRFYFTEAISPLHEGGALRSLLDEYAAVLSALGGDNKVPGPGQEPLPRVVMVASGGTEQGILEAVHPLGRDRVLLVAHPGHNSLAAAMEVLARVQQLGGRGEIHYLEGPRDEPGLLRLGAAISDAAVWGMLRRTRIGLVGAPSDWLVASSPKPEVVRTRWGPEVISIPIETIVRAPDGGLAADSDVLAKQICAGAAAQLEPTDHDVKACGGVHGLIRKLVREHRLDAVAVRCFDLVARRGVTGCLALSQLNDEGIIAGCEGDVVATIAMLWVHRMTGSLPWMANPARMQIDRGLLSLAHCTVARSLVQSYRLRSHFESGLGVGIQGLMPIGPVTLVRIGGETLGELRAVEGRLARNTDHPDLCRTQVEVEVASDALREMLACPLGNHVVLVAGLHAERLQRWHASMVA